MLFKIHFEYADTSEDSLIIEADTIEEIQAKAAEEVNKRNATPLYSEQLD